MMNIIVILIVAAIVGVAIAYIVKEKKKGTKCIGCSMSENCSRAKKDGCKKTKTE